LLNVIESFPPELARVAVPPVLLLALSQLRRELWSKRHGGRLQPIPELIRKLNAALPESDGRS
jgi:hypothetical protein